MPGWRAARTGLIAAWLIGLALLPAACNRPRPAPARPALFVVQDADTTIWLFGTIHLLPAGIDWQTPAMRDAVARSDLLVTEIPNGQLQGGAATFEKIAYAKTLPPELTRVSPNQRRALLRALDAAGLTLAEADHLKTWAIATLIGGGAARAMDATRDNGVETVLASAFADAHKPQAGLESLTGQLGLFDTLPESEQRALLSSSLANLADPKRGYQATLDSWRRGDVAAMAASFDPAFGNHPLLEETLVTARNRRWVNWIAGRMRAPGTILVAVGAGHLSGPKSVIAMLQARGFAVRRVE